MFEFRHVFLFDMHARVCVCVCVCVHCGDLCVYTICSHAATHACLCAQLRQKYRFSGCNHAAAEMWTSSLRVPSPNAAVHTFVGGHSLGPANMTLTDPRHDCHLQVSQDEARGEAAWNMVSYGAAGKAHLTSEPMQNVGGEGFLTLE